MSEKHNIKYTIVADGDFPTSPCPLEVLKESDVVVCCDGAIKSLKAIRIPDYITGDMDSISPEDSALFANIISPCPDQQTNDMTKAFELVLSLISSSKEDSVSITILGGTGKREDHTLGNISLLVQYAHRLDSLHIATSSVSMITDHGRFFYIGDTSTLHFPVHTPVSIFAFDSSVTISSHGLAYPTDNVVFDALWKATLNYTVSDTVTLTFNHPADALVFAGHNKEIKDAI